MNKPVDHRSVWSPPHIRIDMFLCTECGRDFASQLSLKKHVQRVHEESPVNCDKCGVVFKNKLQLINHQRVHVNKLKQCTLCNVVVKAENYSKHVKSHETKSLKFPCGDCAYITHRKDLLSKHMKNLHEVKVSKAKVTQLLKVANDKNIYTCNKCDKTFSFKYNLTVHVKTVHGRKVSYGGHFMVVDDQHVKAHELPKESSSKQYPCDQCDYKATNKNNLGRHIWRVHEQLGVHGGSKKSLDASSRSTLYNRKADSYKEHYEYLKNKFNKEVMEKTTEAEVINLIKTVNISINDLSRVLSTFRVKYGRNMFTPNVKLALREKAKDLEDHFKTEIKQFIDSDGNEVDRALSSVIDLPLFIEIICARRNCDPSKVKLVFGADGGKGKFIVTLAIIPEESKSNAASVSASGGKQILIVAEVAKIPEKHQNLKVVFDELRLSQLSRDYSVICDVKCIVILCGISGTSSMHSCPYCEGYKVNKQGKKTNQKGEWLCGNTLRTMGSLMKHFKKWDKDTVDWSRTKARKELQHYFNVEFPPVFFLNPEDEDKLVIDVLPPPYLHCVLLGPFNNVWAVLRKEAPDSIKAFENKYNMKPDGQGGEYSGPTIKKIVHSEVILEDLQSCLEETHVPLLTCLKSIGELHNICRSRILNPSYKQVISDFNTNWDQCTQMFGLSKTLKIHIICDHLEQYFTKTGSTLLDKTDETTESGHSTYSKFERIHGMFVRDEMSPAHHKQQHKRIVWFNSYNV
jgi:hypothetical protein